MDYINQYRKTNVCMFECRFAGIITFDQILKWFFLSLHVSEENRSLDNGTIICDGNTSDGNQKLWIFSTITHFHLTAFSWPPAEENTSNAPSSAEFCCPESLSSNNNPQQQQQTILITEQRASGCSGGQRLSAAYYSHCSPNDPAGLRRISKLSEQLLARNLRVDFFVSTELELMGKGTFSPPWSLTRSCSLLSAFHTTEPFLSSFILFFFRGLDPPAASSYLTTPGEQHGPRPYLWEAHFPEGNLPASTLGSALKWWTSETWPLFVCSPLISEAERLCCHPASPLYLHHWHRFAFPLSSSCLPLTSSSVRPKL